MAAVPAWPRLSVFGDEIADDLDAQVAALHHHDVRFLELRAAWGTNVVDLSNAQVEQIDRRLADAGVGVSAVASPVGKTPITGAFDAEQDRFRRALTVARRVGAPLVRIFSFFIPNGGYREHRDEVIRRLATFAREAEATPLTLVLENESYTYADTAARCREVIDRVGSPALGCAFDPANFVQTGQRPFTEAWPLLAPLVKHVHIKDAVPVDRTGAPPYPARVPGDRLVDSVRLPGEGQGELRPILRDLIANGYRGFLAIEPHLQHRLPDRDGPDRFGAAVGALRHLMRDVENAMV